MDPLFAGLPDVRDQGIAALADEKDNGGEETAVSRALRRILTDIQDDEGAITAFGSFIVN